MAKTGWTKGRACRLASPTATVELADYQEECRGKSSTAPPGDDRAFARLTRSIGPGAGNDDRFM
jgi:hypothetical protein